MRMKLKMVKKNPPKYSVVCFDTRARSIFIRFGGSLTDSLRFSFFTSKLYRYINYKCLSGLETVLNVQRHYLEKLIMWIECSLHGRVRPCWWLSCLPIMQILSSNMLEEFKIHKVFSVPILKFWCGKILSRTI